MRRVFRFCIGYGRWVLVLTFLFLAVSACGGDKPEESDDSPPAIVRPALVMFYTDN